MSEKKIIDWHTIKNEYRAGIKSLRVIAGEHGVTEGAIRKCAKRDLWGRDLAPKIKVRTDDLLRRATVRSAVRAETAVSDRALVEVNAHVQTNIILSHRTDIFRTRRLAMTLLEELEIATCANELLRDLATLMYKSDQNGIDKLSEIFLKVISMPGRIDSLKKLSDTLKTLIGLEREAFGIDGKEDAGNSEIESLIKRVLEKRSTE